MAKRPNANNCCVYGCMNKQRDTELSFFKLPRDADRRNVWLIKIGREDLLRRPNLKDSSYKVCSAHFDHSVMSEVLIRQLSPGAVPSKLLPNKEPSSWEDVEKPSNKPRSAGISTQTDESFIKTMSAARAKNAYKMSGNKEGSTQMAEESDKDDSTSGSGKRKIGVTSELSVKKKKKSK